MSKLIIHNKIKDRTLCLSDLEGTFDDVINVIRQWKSDYEGLVYRDWETSTSTIVSLSLRYVEQLRFGAFIEDSK